MGRSLSSAGNDLTESVEHRYIDAGDDLRLHVAISGKGPPLVLLHGFTGSTESWGALRFALQDHLTLIAVDFAGHGRSSSPDDPARYSAEWFNDDLETICDKLDLERTALMGYSMGGRFALRFALAHTARVSALILESTSPGIADSAERAARVASDGQLAQSIEADGIEKFVSHWESLSLWASQSDLAETMRGALRAQRLENDPRGLANSLRGAGAGMMNALSPAEMHSIDVPTLLVAGELDAAYVAHAQSMQRSLPEARVHIVPHAGHAVHFEKPAELAATVRQFLLNSERE